MSPERHAVWGGQGLEIQKEQWKAKLKEWAGNITRAGKSMGFSKKHAMRLTRMHELTDYAAELRKKANGNTHGRPLGGG